MFAVWQNQTCISHWFDSFSVFFLFFGQFEIWFDLLSKRKFEFSNRSITPFVSDIYI